ncbi:chaplin [Streptomyces sp. NBC_00728]
MVLAAAATGIMSLYASPAFADSTATATASDSPGVVSGNNVQVPVNVPVNLCGNTVDVVAALNPAFGNSCANGSGSHVRHAAPQHAAPQLPSQQQHHAGSGYGPGYGGADHTRGHGGQAGHPGAGYGGYGGSGYGDSGYGDSGHGQSGYGDSGYGDSGHGRSGYGDSGAHHGGWGGSSSYGGTYGSPGVLSGNQVGAPIDVPVELCGNTVDVIALANPVSGNSCGHHHGPDGHATTPHHCTPPATPPHTPPRRVHQHPPTHTPSTPIVHTPPVTVHQRHTPPAALAETGAEGMLANAAVSAALLAGGAVLYRRSRAASRP